MFSFPDVKIKYIFTSIDFIYGIFEDIVFLLWAIGNCIQYITYNSYMADKYEIINNTAYNVTEFIKWLALAIGLFIALTGGGIFIKVLFILGIILGIVILIIMALFGILCSGVDAVGQMAVTTYRAAKPIVVDTIDSAIEIINFIGKTIDDIGNYFKEIYGNVVRYIKIKKLPEKSLYGKKITEARYNGLKKGSGYLAGSIKEARDLNSNENILGDSIIIDTELKDGIYEIIQ